MRQAIRCSPLTAQINRPRPIDKTIHQISIRWYPTVPHQLMRAPRSACYVGHGRADVVDRACGSAAARWSLNDGYMMSGHHVVCVWESRNPADAIQTDRGDDRLHDAFDTSIRRRQRIRLVPSGIWRRRHDTEGGECSGRLAFTRMASPQYI